MTDQRLLTVLVFAEHTEALLGRELLESPFEIIISLASRYYLVAGLGVQFSRPSFHYFVELLPLYNYQRHILPRQDQQQNSKTLCSGVFNVLPLIKLNWI